MAVTDELEYTVQSEINKIQKDKYKVGKLMKLMKQSRIAARKRVKEKIMYT